MNLLTCNKNSNNPCFKTLFFHFKFIPFDFANIIKKIYLCRISVIIFISLATNLSFCDANNHLFFAILWIYILCYFWSLDWENPYYFRIIYFQYRYFLIGSGQYTNWFSKSEFTFSMSLLLYYVYFLHPSEITSFVWPYYKKCNKY